MTTRPAAKARSLPQRELAPQRIRSALRRAATRRGRTALRQQRPPLWSSPGARPRGRAGATGAGEEPVGDASQTAARRRTPRVPGGGSDRKGPGRAVERESTTASRQGILWVSGGDGRVDRHPPARANPVKWGRERACMVGGRAGHGLSGRSARAPCLSSSFWWRLHNSRRVPPCSLQCSGSPTRSRSRSAVTSSSPHQRPWYVCEMWREQLPGTYRFDPCQGRQWSSVTTRSPRCPPVSRQLSRQIPAEPLP